MFKKNIHYALNDIAEIIVIHSYKIGVTIIHSYKIRVSKVKLIQIKSSFQKLNYFRLRTDFWTWSI